MDCCAKQDSNENTKKLKGGFKMDRKIVLWIVIAIMFLAVLYLTFKTSSINAQAVQSTGITAQSAASSAASSSGGMVGGC